LSLVPRAFVTRMSSVEASAYAGGSEEEGGREREGEREER
jgi:hypothetical protein